MEQLKIEYINIEELIPYINNPRNNENAVDAVADSIVEFGFKNPIIVDKDNIIIAGHTRLLAARKLEMTEVPIIRAEDLTEQQVKAFRIADNRTAEFSEWDEELLALELSDIGDIFTGFSLEEINGMSENDDIKEDDFDAEPKADPKSQLGQVYQLGNHRLMCGDSTNTEDVLKLMGGELADGLVTDPPYNVAYEGGTKDKMTIQNDNLKDDEFSKLLIDAFANADRSMKQGGAFYIWHADGGSMAFRNACNSTGWKIRQCLIWVKNTFVLGRQDYQWAHEPCLYGWKDGAAHYFVADRTQATVIEDKLDINKMKKDEMKELLKQLLEQKVPTTAIHEDKPICNDKHPTMKPIKLIARLITNSFKKNQIVLDLFGGSGTTIMACEQIDRTCYMMEYDPRYVDVIIERWEEFTGRKAELLD